MSPKVTATVYIIFDPSDLIHRYGALMTDIDLEKNERFFGCEVLKVEALISFDAAAGAEGLVYSANC